MWSDEALHDLVISALLGYLAVAHYGRGRGDWKPSESPPFWRDTVVGTIEARRAGFEAVWTERAKRDAAALAAGLRPLLADAMRDVLRQLYPDASEAIDQPGTATR
jgi:hypothetical protein